MLTSLPVESMGVASHPAFSDNRLVFVSLLERERAGETRLRIVRLREVGGALGEAATLFEAPVAGDANLSQSGARMAFGPDRLLYVMLPPGLEFVDEPAASSPRAAMLRVTDEGRVAPGEPLTGVTSTPLGFAWHPDTGALWVMSRGQNGEAAARALGGRDRVQAMSAHTPRLLGREGVGAAAGTLLVHSAPDDLVLAQTLLRPRADGSKGLARLALPLWNLDAGMSDRVGDVVAGDGGTLFVATSNGLVGGAPGMANDVVVRLKPVAASR
jgi:glucose/arabinose dehydrogenase